MKTHVFRLKPNQDLRTSIDDYARENNIKAGAILTCVGSLKHATIRMANASALDKSNQSKDLRDCFQSPIFAKIYQPCPVLVKKSLQIHRIYALFLTAP